MKNYEIERKKWRRAAHRYAKKRNPEGCLEEKCWMQCGEPCRYCQDVQHYMEVMEDHADVLLSTAKECPF